jgi:hypothetical protein
MSGEIYGRDKATRIVEVTTTITSPSLRPLQPGAYLLTVEAKMPGATGTIAARRIPFSVR